MAQLTPETIWHMSDAEFSECLDDGLFLPASWRIRFYAPSFMYYKTCDYCSSPLVFPTISVTGSGCALRCKHCGGKVLETMYPVAKPEELVELCRQLKEHGGVGCLVSGGCLSDGSVPLGGFVDAIGRVKRELGLTVFVHTGIIDHATACSLVEAGVDAALIDVVGSDETIREVYNLDVTVADYERSLRALSDSGIVFVPHVVAGLHHGRLKGELDALRMTSRYEPSAVVVIAFMPIRGTAMEKVVPLEPLGVARVVAAARLMFRRTPLVLGCMRPKGRHRVETDVLAVKAGVDAVAFPAEEAVDYAKKQGFEVSFSPFCCSQVYADIKGLAALRK